MQELVAKGASLIEVLDALTQAIERMAPECLCTIMLLDEVGRHLLRGSGPSLPAAYMEAINGLEIGPEVGACGTAAFRNETVVVEDIATDHLFAGPRDLVMSFGLRACWSVPIRDSKGKVLGTFAMYHRQPAKPREWELRPVEAGAQLAGNAIGRLRDEQRLREIAERLALAERAASFGIWQVEVPSGTVTLSEGLAALFDSSFMPRRRNLEELSGMLHPDDRVVLQDTVKKAMATQETLQAEFRVVLADGTIRWQRCQGQVKFAGGLPELATGALIDITGEKTLLMRLQEARAAAEAAADTKGQFLANMSHEIRTPMNGIMGMTDLFLETELTAEQREYLSIVKSSAAALLKIINDILDFSKIEARSLELESVEFDLRNCLAEVVKSMALSARKKGVELICSVESNVPHHMVGDPTRLRQIVTNLVGNSLKFTDRGKVTLEAIMESDSGANCVVHFIVRDSGIGISKDKQAVIFHAFSQADNSTTRKFGGTGLGLSISSRLVEMMGGRIWVESEVGQGSKFHFTANFGVTRTSPNISAHMPESRSAQDPLQGHAPAPPRLRLLLAEDNLVNQRLAVRLLEKQGHSVDVANNGREALEALNKESYYAVLMDVQMPEMDGFEATTVIRKTEAGTGTHLPIIAMTAHALSGDRERCLAAGMDCYISKPIKTQELYQLLASLSQRAASIEVLPA